MFRNGSNLRYKLVEHLKRATSTRLEPAWMSSSFGRVIPMQMFNFDAVLSPGEPVNTHAGESLHKGLKSFAASCKGGDNIPHIMRRQNARMAAECMEEGLR